MNKGIDYTLFRSGRKSTAIQVKDGEVIVRGPLNITRSQADRFVKQHERWINRQLKKQEADAAAGQKNKLRPKDVEELKKEAREVIPERVAYYAKKMGVTYGRVTIRSQKTRWGSCSEKGNLNFNCLLMMMPMQVLDSVVVHELCHLKYMNHSKQFYALVRSVFPEYDRWHRWLKKNGGRYLQMLP